METIGGLVLKLHTDISNLRTYEGNRALIEALVHTAEEKLAIIAAHLMEVRRANGMGACAVIVDMRATGGR